MGSLFDISYDYIRSNYEGKEFRYIAQGLAENHFFGNKEIWESFKLVHFNNIEKIKDNEDPVPTDSRDLNQTLKARDEAYREKAAELLEDNLQEHRQKLGNIKHKNEPSKLIDKAIDLVAVVGMNPNTSNPEVIKKVELLKEKIDNTLMRKSPKMMLDNIYSQLLSIELDADGDDKQELLEVVKAIGKQAYQLEKAIKHI